MQPEHYHNCERQRGVEDMSAVDDSILLEERRNEVKKVNAKSRPSGDSYKREGSALKGYRFQNRVIQFSMFLVFVGIAVGRYKMCAGKPLPNF